MEKNDSGVLEEKVDISLFYEIIFSKILNKETKEKLIKDIQGYFLDEHGEEIGDLKAELLVDFLLSNLLLLGLLQYHQ